jgi:flagellar biosynthesis regulator FlbT
MTKDEVINALNAIQGGADAGRYYDELELAVRVLMDTSEEKIKAAYDEIHEAAETEQQQN